MFETPAARCACSSAIDVADVELEVAIAVASVGKLDLPEAQLQGRADALVLGVELALLLHLEILYMCRLAVANDFELRDAVERVSQWQPDVAAAQVEIQASLGELHAGLGGL